MRCIHPTHKLDARRCTKAFVPGSGSLEHTPMGQLRNFRLLGLLHAQAMAFLAREIAARPGASRDLFTRRFGG